MADEKTTRRYRIPFNRPTYVGTELHAIAEAVASGHISGDGSFTKRCQALLAAEVGAPSALLSSSCTHAIEMAALLLEIKPGDEVIVPSFTFVSSINPFVLRGARPVFCDVRADTLNIDEQQLEALVTERTRAIVVVHYAGVGCEMDEIMKIASRHGIAVIEDNAHGLFGTFRGRPLGSFGALSTLSFHETKNVTCGEGGALVINDSSFIERAEILREKGTNRSRFFRGEVDKYTWVDIGSSYLLSDAMAAFLWAQLEARVEIQAQRRRIWNTYFDELAEWAEGTGARLPIVPPHCVHPAHLFYVLHRTEQARDAFIERLRAVGIQSVFHYQSLHESPMGRKLSGGKNSCPVSSAIAGRLVRLPFFTGLTEVEQREIVETIRQSGTSL